MTERKPAKADTQQSAGKASRGFTAEERAAMKERVRDLQEEALANADKAQREAAALAKAAGMPGPEQEREWLQQNNLTYGALIAIGVIMVQPFLTAGSLDLSAEICVIAFSVAIPLLAALVLVNRQEVFRGRRTRSLIVTVAQVAAQGTAFVGVVAGFWHINWIAGVGVLSSAVVAMGVHSAGWGRLELDGKPSDSLRGNDEEEGA
jgi:hypothetical protein